MPSSHSGSSLYAGKSLLDTRPLSKDDILSLFSYADELDARSKKHLNFYNPQKTDRISKVVCCLFFEPSTRTRMSFQTAAYRLGHQVLTMDLAAGSSLSKGETYADTVVNIAAMRPDVIVIRYGISQELDELLPELSIPVINAGNGTMAHPTQGLLDAYTIYREKRTLEGQRVLVVGDIKHSRVARSNFDILQKLGAEVAICGPERLLPESGDLPGVRRFLSLDEAIEWCDIYMGLRIQLERHDAASLNMKSLGDYHTYFGLNQSRLKNLRKHAMIMHPGPINHGVEFSAEVLKDSRCRVLAQVSNGVLVRAALLSRILGDES